MKKLLLILSVISIFSTSAEAIIKKPAKLIKLSQPELANKIYIADKELIKCTVHFSLTKTKNPDKYTKKKEEARLTDIKSIRYMLFNLINQARDPNYRVKYYDYYRKLEGQYSMRYNGKGKGFTYNIENSDKILNKCNRILKKPLKTLKLNKYIGTKGNTRKHIKKLSRIKPWTKKPKHATKETFINKIYAADKKITACIIHFTLMNKNDISYTKKTSPYIENLSKVRKNLLNLIKKDIEPGYKAKHSAYYDQVRNKYTLQNGEYYINNSQELTNNCQALNRHPLSILYLNNYVKKKPNSRKYIKK